MYIDNASISQAQTPRPDTLPPFAAHVQLKSALPTILLEEHEGFIESIACHGSKIELGFNDAGTLSAVWKEMHKYPDLQVITSHVGCNLNGERMPYLYVFHITKAFKVTNSPSVSNMEKTMSSIVLSATPASWRQCFHSININFGSHDDNAALKRHDHDLIKRQATPTSKPAAAPAVSYPPAPTLSPTSTKVAAASISTAWLGTTILPPTFPGASFVGPDLPAGLDVKCKNCSLQGSVSLSAGAINLDTNTTDDGPFEVVIDDIVNYFETGYVDLALDSFSAHIELESTVKPSASLVTYVAPFPDIGLPGFTIPKIASVGPILRPHITFGVQLATELDFTYGFDLSVPKNSTIHLDINHPIDNSTIKG